VKRPAGDPFTVGERVNRLRGEVPLGPGVGEDFGRVGGGAGGESGEHVGQVGPGIEAVPAGGAAYAQEHGGGFQAAVASDM
jgi:hypothetical protein